MRSCDDSKAITAVARTSRSGGVAMGALKALTEDGLFIGQRNPAFFDLMRDLAEDADEAQRGGGFV